MRRTAGIVGVGLALSLGACSETPAITPIEAMSTTPVENGATPAVVSAAAASVAIRGSEMQGSGEVVTLNGHKVILSAGHVGKLAAGARCGNVEVDMATKGKPEKVPVHSVAGVYEEKSAFTARDIALLGVEKSALDNMPAAPLATQMPGKGADVFIISWQPEGTGSMMGSQRNPVEGLLTKPAIIGATYEGQTTTNVAVFRPNGTSYDATTGQKTASDTTFKSEGSGSAVVNKQGEVIAEVARGGPDNLALLHPDQQAELERALGEPFDGSNGVALGHIVTSPDFASVQTQSLVPKAECPLAIE